MKQLFLEIRNPTGVTDEELRETPNVAIKKGYYIRDAFLKLDTEGRYALRWGMTDTFIRFYWNDDSEKAVENLTGLFWRARTLCVKKRWRVNCLRIQNG